MKKAQSKHVQNKNTFRILQKNKASENNSYFTFN